VAGLGAGQPDSVVGDSQGLHQSTDVGAEVAEWVDPTTLRDDKLREASPETRQADEPTD
jgi:hypothetical protein